MNDEIIKTIVQYYNDGKAAGYDDATTKQKDRCPCGGIILADTEDWSTPLCYECVKTPLKEITELTRKLEVAKKALGKYANEETHSMDEHGFTWGGDYFDYETARAALKELE